MTDISDIIKSLDWEYHNGVFLSKEKGSEEFTNYNIHVLDNNAYAIRYNEIIVYPLRIYKTLEEAKIAVFKLYNFDKLQFQLTPFWKPIEQCPKVKNINYLIFHKHEYTLVCVWDNTINKFCLSFDLEQHFSEEFILAFAEIPAYEVQS